VATKYSAIPNSAALSHSHSLGRSSKIIIAQKTPLITVTKLVCEVNIGPAMRRISKYRKI
jgi:hypothetical protein